MRLVARGLRHSFGGIEVLRGVDLEVAEGESLAVLGPSGSGKSTLLALLGGLLAPKAGSVELEAPPAAAPGLTEAVAWVHQVPAALRSRSALDNVALGALAAGATRAEASAIAVELLARLGLTGRVRQAAGRLSSGELQRVAIGRALAVEAPFILADEPTGQLDRATSEEVCRLLIDAGVEEMGRALVIVTHDGAVAARCRRALELVDGRLSS